ncbi:MAG TPA: bile acid:sodium symporter family protein [Bacteroidales bacterium]|nr:bile acid:sodium symporter family protein [Bacteroidales bacterium]HOH83506.1 bile acid:sodium symporter family protein [Bacteroidales bacterium]HQN17254.1 bile acid:sodium symporter family protein [Bacteroidales bacterium]
MADSTYKVLKIVKIAKRWGLDWFILALVAAIVLAFLWPEAGYKESVIPLSTIATWGISVIFFFYGLKLNPQKLKSGLKNWRVHLVIQLTTFGFFPLLVIIAKSIIGTAVDENLWLGIFFLACLPGTISSSVVLVSIAKGNMPSAIFNSSISTLLGIFITPFWIGLYLGTSSADFDFGPVIIKLLLQVLFPVILGMLLHFKWGAAAEKYGNILAYFNQIVILLIVYTSFCDSFANNIFAGYSAVMLMLLGASLILLFYIVYFVVFVAGRLLGFSREEKITALFCGSNKSLVHGSLMSKVLFAGSPLAGVVLLPIMMYHALQLVMGSIIAQRFAGNISGANS